MDILYKKSGCVLLRFFYKKAQNYCIYIGILTICGCFVQNSHIQLTNRRLWQNDGEESEF